MRVLVVKENQTNNPSDDRNRGARHNVFGTTMNAVILYDEFEIAAKTHAVLTQATRRADAAVPWTIHPLRMDMLMRPPAAADALQAAAAAHLIVIAVCNQAELPSRLLNWLETWARHRDVHDAALAVFQDRNGDVLSTPPTPALAEFAERHGLCFLFGDAEPHEEEGAAMLNDLHEREVAMTSTLAHIMEQAPKHDYGMWGIND